MYLAYQKTTPNTSKKRQENLIYYCKPYYNLEGLVAMEEVLTSSIRETPNALKLVDYTNRCEEEK
jgi:hypothetical protein